MHLLAVATAPGTRPGADYLQATLDGVERAGGWPEAERFVYHDGGNVPMTPGWRVIGTPERRGATRARWMLFRMMLDLGADWVTVLEDDLLFCRETMSVIREAPALVPIKLALVSWFDCLPAEKEPVGTGLFRVGPMIPRQVTAQAVSFRDQTLERLLRADVTKLPQKLPDYATALVLRKSWIGISRPSLVQHVGVVSGYPPPAVVFGPPPRSPHAVSWPGEDFDATSLLARAAGDCGR